MATLPRVKGNVTINPIVDLTINIDPEVLKTIQGFYDGKKLDSHFLTISSPNFRSSGNKKLYYIESTNLNTRRTRLYAGPFFSEEEAERALIVYKQPRESWPIRYSSILKDGS